MPRTVINPAPDDKRWLDQEARERQVPMTELVRQAVSAYRLREQNQSRPSLEAALEKTAGIWKHDDALAYQKRLRSEWNRRP